MDETAAGREAALLALLDAGALPGVEAVGPDQPIGPGDILVFRVPRDAAEGGISEGERFGDELLSRLPGAAGRILLAFDGWASDPRPLARVPEVVRFCQGTLFGSGRPDLSRACLLYTSPSPRDKRQSRMPSSA